MFPEKLNQSHLMEITALFVPHSSLGGKALCCKTCFRLLNLKEWGGFPALQIPNSVSIECCCFSFGNTFE